VPRNAGTRHPFVDRRRVVAIHSPSGQIKFNLKAIVAHADVDGVPFGVLLQAQLGVVDVVVELRRGGKGRCGIKGKQRGAWVRIKADRPKAGPSPRVSCP